MANHTSFEQSFSSRFTVRVIALLGVGNVVAAAATIFGIGTEDGGPPPLWFLGLCWLVWLWLAYVFLCRTAVSLRVHEGQLVWQAPAREGAVPLTAIQSIRASGLFLFRFRFVGGGWVLVFDGDGLSKFITKLHRLNPEIAVWRRKLRR